MQFDKPIYRTSSNFNPLNEYEDLLDCFSDEDYSQYEHY